ncbi:hypothetical protein INR49_029252 [Caranx melampygus]|nr:hypothetical protein INR49_029252 [Caranx melampygus]
MISTTVKIVAFLAAAWCWTSEAVLYDVACPGVQGELHCPEDSRIFVVAMKHGVESDADCELRDQPAQVSDSDCIHPLMLAWAKNYCDSKQYCRLPKPTPEMFLCEYSPDTFYQVSYECLMVPERGTVHVMYTNFGRNNPHTCTKTPSRYIFCTSDEAEPAVKELCDGKKECTLTATTEDLGEPVNCDDNPFFLTVDYMCMRFTSDLNIPEGNGHSSSWVSYHSVAFTDRT